ATGHTLCREHAAEDLPEGPENLVRIDDQHDHAGRHVHQGHERHHLLRHLGDRADAADDHHAHQHRHDQAEDPALAREHAVGAAGHAHHLLQALVGLEHVAAANGTAHATHREEHRQ